MNLNSIRIKSNKMIVKRFSFLSSRVIQQPEARIAMFIKESFIKNPAHPQIFSYRTSFMQKMRINEINFGPLGISVIAKFKRMIEKHKQYNT